MTEAATKLLELALDGLGLAALAGIAFAAGRIASRVTALENAVERIEGYVIDFLGRD